MNLDIIAQLVQILRDAPELGAIEVRRGLFGTWSSVRVSKAGHSPNAGGGHIVVTQAPPAAALPLTTPGEGAALQAAPASKLLESKSPMVETFYSAPQPGAPPYVKEGRRVAAGQVGCIIEAKQVINEIEPEFPGV